MKTKQLLIFTFAFLCITSSWSQVIEISPTYGYQFGAKLNYGYNNYLKIEGSEQFGITVGVEADDYMMVDITYVHQSTDLRIRDAVISPIEKSVTDFSADWVLVGVTRYFGDGKVMPYFGGSLGGVFLTSKNVNYDIINYEIDNNTKFAFAFKGGVNIMLTEVVGIKLQGDLFFPISWGGVYVGGGYSGVSVSGSSIIAGVSGGLVFRLGSS